MANWLTNQGLRAVFADVASAPLNFSRTLISVAQGAGIDKPLLFIALGATQLNPLLAGLATSSLLGGSTAGGVGGIASYWAAHLVQNIWMEREGRKRGVEDDLRRSGIVMTPLFPRMTAYARGVISGPQ